MKLMRNREVQRLLLLCLLGTALIAAAGFCAGIVPGVLALAGIGLDAQVLLIRVREGHRSLGVGRAIAACALVLAGIFVMRFAFYMMHLTVGLGV